MTAFDPYFRLKGIIPYLVNSEFGVIRKITELVPQPDMPKVFYYKAIISNTGYGPKNRFPVSGGTSLNRDRALAKAVGEAVERYCSGNYFREQITYSSYSDIKRPAIAPDSFNYFNKIQYLQTGFPLKEWKNNTVIGWADCTRYINGDLMLLPAVLVYCPYYINPEKNEAAIFENISTGLAAHITIEDATLNGLLEVIERDFFISTWLLEISHPLIDVKSLNDNHLELINQFENSGYQIQLAANIHSSGIPGIIGVIKGKDSSRIPVQIAAATHWNASNAITKCLEELALIERFARRKMIGLGESRITMNPFEVTGLTEHIDYWLNPDKIGNLGFLTHSTNKIRLDQLQPNYQGTAKTILDPLIHKIENNGYEVYVSDLTPNDIKSLGMHAVRVLVPGYLPLNKSYLCRPIDSPRLGNVSFGFEVARKDYRNQEPHPFA